MGFAANDALTMAHNPELLHAFGGMIDAVYGASRVPVRTKRLVGYMVSSAAGCTYCQSHTGHSALNSGIEAADLERIWDYETNAHFTPAERSALRIAHHAALTPNQVDDAMYAEFAAHFDTDAQLEIVAVISLFGFLNRWNATLATTIEGVPAASLHTLALESDPK